MRNSFTSDEGADVFYVSLAVENHRTMILQVMDIELVICLTAKLETNSVPTNLVIVFTYHWLLN